MHVPGTSFFTSAAPKIIQPDVINVLAAAFLLLVIVGNLLWLAEHRAQPQNFDPRYSRGIDEGMWVAIVTMATVGYGDRVPITG